jgi:hypothetical protein
MADLNYIKEFVARSLILDVYLMNSTDGFLFCQNDKHLLKNYRAI